MNDRIIINLDELLGVDPETMRRADAGDRLAQKKILRKMWTRDASPQALASTQSWMYWVLRMIGAGSRQTIADVWGVVEVQRATGRLAPEHADAIDQLVEQFVGPGVVNEETRDLVRSTFTPGSTENAVIELFLVHDRLASGDPNVSIAEMAHAAQVSELLGADGPRAFFLGVLAQHVAQAGYIDDAIQLAEEVLAVCERLAEADPEYERRVGVTAMLLAQLYGFAGDGTRAAAIGNQYANAINAYTSAEP